MQRVRTHELTTDQQDAIRQLLDAAFNVDERRFTDDDWQHALGGVHFVLEVDGAIRGHAAVVERELCVAGVSKRTGYVEAVATAPAYQGAGLGSQLMRDVGVFILSQFELGALATGRNRFYERFDWRTWRGPTSVRTPAGELRTPGEDGHLMVLATPASATLDITLPISCEWRPGAVW